MKKFSYICCRKVYIMNIKESFRGTLFIIGAVLMFCQNQTAGGANQKRTVSQVTSAIKLSASVDYHITGATPFAESGSIDIQNTDHAVVIFDALRPSQALSWLNHVTINGATARNGNNCQVRVYGKGAIVYPYSRNFRPLTAYDETDCQGNSYSSYTTGSNNGFMRNLTAAQLNNRIKSFTLKRGYMVTFATRAGGYGYSRCYIADDEDLSVTLPVWLQGRFSSYRLFQWNDVSKCGWGGTQVECMAALNATWCYEWGAPDPQNTDWECVAQHHHEGWPGIDEVGRNGTSCHALGNNEPDNQADASEQYQTVQQVLEHWPEMMATGKRLGTPAMAGNRAWLKEFSDSIDARGWRCDFCAIHLYFGGNQWDWDWQVNDYFNQSNQRPIWITEMNTGAEWTDWWGGGDRSANQNNYNIQKDHFAPVLDMLMGHDKVERIAPFNAFWSDKCRMFYNWDDADPVTPIGHYYADLQPGLAYSGSYDKVPNRPRMYGPQDATLTFRQAAMINVITWKDVNGDFNTDMWVERKEGSSDWTRIMTAKQIDGDGSYTCRDTVRESSAYAYRVALKTVFSNDIHYSTVLGNTQTTARPMTDDERVQWGVLESGSAESKAFCYFSHPFAEQPAIVFGSPSDRNSFVAPCELCDGFGKNADGSFISMSFRYFPWTLESQTTFSSGTENSTVIVAEPGTGNIGTLRYEAGYVTSQATAGTILTYSFSQPFEGVPVVMASPYSTGTAYPFICRVFDVSATGFKVVLQRQKGLDGVSDLQSQTAAVAFFAIEQGETLDALNRKVQVKTGKKHFTSTTATTGFTFSPHLSRPSFLVQMQSMARQDVIALIRQINPKTDDVGTIRISLQHDPTGGYEVTSRNAITETFGYIAISETDETTDGIQTIQDSKFKIQNDDAIYDLQGRKLQSVPAKGIYIKDGKKIIR